MVRTGRIFSKSTPTAPRPVTKATWSPACDRLKSTPSLDRNRGFSPGSSTKANSAGARPSTAAKILRRNPRETTNRARNTG